MVILGDDVLGMSGSKGAQVRIADPSDSFPRQAARKDDSVVSISRLRAGAAQVSSAQCMHYTQEDRGEKNVQIGT